MESFFLLLGLFLLAAPVIAVVALVKSIGFAERLRRADARLAAIESAIAALASGPAMPTAPTAPASIAPSPAPAPASEQSPPTPESRHGIGDHPQAAAPSAMPDPQPRATVPSPLPPPMLPPAMSLEQRLGAQWAVWVGGLALALGGIFLVRYSIEQGLLGPRVRITLGALLATALIIAGEWARRGERLAGIAGLPSAHIPSILTAAGTTVAYADIYAAHALYSFLAPGMAFILLGVAALATLAAAMLHGPALAGLGLVGAYATPLLVVSDRADYWSLYIYLAVVTAAAFALARLRMWRWLAIAAIVLSVMWTLPGVGVVSVEALGAHIFHVVTGFTLATTLIVAGLLWGPDAQPGRIDPVSSAALSVYLLVAACLVLASRHDPVAFGAFVALVTLTIAISWRSDAAAGAIPAAALLAVLVIVRWALDLDLAHLLAPSGLTAGGAPKPETAEPGWHLALGIGFALLFGVTGYRAQGRSQQPLVPMLWSGSAVFAPIAILAALYFRIAEFAVSIPFSGCALLLAALFAVATERLGRRPPRPGIAVAGALFATGAIAALALALTMALERGWLTVGLALVVPGVAWVSERRPLPALRVLAAVVGVIVLARIAWEPRIVGGNVGATPIFNWLLYGYGIPAAAFWLGGYLLRRRGDDVPARMIDSGAIVLTVLLAFLEIRHFMNAGDVYRPGSGLAEVALQVCVGLAMAIGLERLRQRTNSVVHNVGALAIAALAFAAIVLGLAVGENPLFTGEPVGGRFVNLVLLAYAVPAMLAAALAWLWRATRPPQYSAAAAVTAVALALGYLSLQVRTLFRGEVLTRGSMTDAEQYTYSVVWLAFGVILLAAGVGLRSSAVRFSSAAVVIMAVLKVFLVDMRGLTGLYQALSFLGLGIVLLGIGWLYQRLLFPARVASGRLTTEAS
jgi:uncharacterized membrane protein